MGGFCEATDRSRALGVSMGETGCIRNRHGTSGLPVR